MPTTTTKTRAQILEDELAFYGCFHSHPGNQCIHFLFVPPILATLCVWLAYCRSASAPALLSFLPFSVLNPAAAVIFAYSFYYTSLEPLAGVSWSLCQGLPIWLGATAARVLYPDVAWKWSAGLHALAWAVQVGVGHALIEKRRPALTVSLSQALGSAALFAWLEGLFALGYRPGLKAVLDARVEKGQAAMVRKEGLRRRGRG